MKNIAIMPLARAARLEKWKVLRCSGAPASASREEVEAAARINENVLRFTEGLTIRKVIVVPGKLVNIVAS